MLLLVPGFASAVCVSIFAILFGVLAVGMWMATRWAIGLQLALGTVSIIILLLASGSIVMGTTLRILVRTRAYAVGVALFSLLIYGSIIWVSLKRL